MLPWRQSGITTDRWKEEMFLLQHHIQYMVLDYPPRYLPRFFAFLDRIKSKNITEKPRNCDPNSKQMDECTCSSLSAFSVSPFRKLPYFYCDVPLRTAFCTLGELKYRRAPVGRPRVADEDRQRWSEAFRTAVRKPSWWASTHKHHNSVIKRSFNEWCFEYK